MNKYEVWYKQITKRGQLRNLESPYERHHIIPKCFGGDNSSSNLTILTAREHFICHWLLTKIHKEGEQHWQMLNALRMMRAENKKQQRYNTKITSRVYAKLKEHYATLLSEKNKGQGNGFYGKKHSDEVKKRISEANLGDRNPSKRPDVSKKISSSKLGSKREMFSEEWKHNMSLAKQGKNNHRYGVEVTIDTREKLRQKKLGTKQSSETIAKKANAVRGSKREKKLCPHCKEMIAVNGYVRWHGDNCKKKDSV